MDFPQRHEGLFPGNPSHAADAPWTRGASAFPAPQHPQSEHFSNRRPLPEQPRAHDGVQRDAVVSNWPRNITRFTRTHTLSMSPT